MNLRGKLIIRLNRLIWLFINMAALIFMIYLITPQYTFQLNCYSNINVIKYKLIVPILTVPI